MLVILTGPTAVGKTALSISLAKELKGEIISADSCQVYQQLNIGSAKIRPEEMEGVPHHLIDAYPPDEPFHVFAFQQEAKRLIREIEGRGHTPMIVGGTGFYIQSVLYDIDFSKEVDHSYRKELEEQALTEEGRHALWLKLQQVDPDYCAECHENNSKRIIRALEFYKQNGYPISRHNEEQREKTSPYDFRYYVLTMDRGKLYERIDRRVDQMMEEGLLKEVEHLKEMGYSRDLLSMQALGYKQIYAYLDGECTLEEAVDAIKENTRHFAKRQLTWFRREKDVIWLDKDAFASEEAILQFILEDLKKI
ncbi:MAG: tRNA (adenosine(37)-N6)-dimethylallyltransferase MiaA [Lachnospiraceae bacterium]|nr:tRNA (adenosine(37)-N6)-dimethylallyltransferase MiaA [Lachnospiraceae bacterium]